MQKIRYYILCCLLLSCLQGMSQHIFASGAHIDTSSPLDFVLGEMATSYTEPAVIGFLPSLYYSMFSSEEQLTNKTSIQAHFDNNLQQATIFMAQEMLQHNPQYAICGMDGVVHLQGTITTTPYFVHYTGLPAGVYILRVSGIPDHIPFITKWFKK